MSYQALNFGTVVNDGTGDTLPVAADKINDNFVEIYGLLGDGTSLSSGISATASVVTLSSPTITGTATMANLDISGDVDIDGTLETDALTIAGVTLAETIADTVGAMVASNTETNITVTYDDSDNTLDFVVDLSGISTISGNAGTATALETARTIHGVSFDGTANIDLTEVVQDTVGAMFSSNTETGITVTYQDADGTIDLAVGTLNQNTTGNAATATALETARTIHGVSFDGTGNIDLSEVIQDTVGAMFSSNTETGIAVSYEDGDGTIDLVVGTLNQDTTGNAATATALETARTIGGTSFDGSANIAVALSATATALATARTIHGVSFDGTANIDLTEVVQDTVGAMFSSNTETGITVTYQDADGTIDLVVGTLNQDTTGNAATATALETSRTIGGVSFDGTGNINLPGVNTSGNQDTSGTAAKVTVTDSNANTNFPVVFHDESNALLDDTGALRYNPSTGELLVPNLTVAGTTTQVNTVTMNAQNAVVFEGATANDFETTLTITDPTADRTITMPDVTGTMALTSSDITGNAATATALATARTIHGVSFDGTGNIDLTEVVQDTVGAMFGSNTETGITVTYQDADGTIDLVVGTLNQDTTGNAATATALETARTIHGVSFDGTGNIDLTEVVQDTVGAMFSSNTETGITVTYQDGDGTIDLVVGTLNQDTTGSAATLTTARTIGGVSFDGSANINLPGVNTAGNQDTSGTAAVATTVTITDNESTDEDNAIVFTAGGDVDGGNLGLESDGTLTYNPSTGIVTATGFAGALTGNVTGNVSGTAATVTGAAQTNITSLGTLTTLTVDNIIINGTNIGHTSDTDSIAIASDGVVTFSQAPVFPDGSIAVADLDIDGATDIGAAITDADLFIIDDGAGGTNRKTTAARIKSYISASATALDDIGAGDGAVTLTTSSGNITIDAAANDSDIILKGTDGGADTTFLTIDGSAAGKATFNNEIVSGAVITSGAGLVIADDGNIGSASDTDAIAIAANGVVTFSQAPVFPDGSINIADIDLDGGTDIGAAIVDADLFLIDDGAGGTMRKTTASRLKTYIQASTAATAADDIGAGDAAVTLTTDTGNITIDAAANDSDIILKGTDGGADTTFLTIDGSAAGEATFNAGIVIADAGTIGSASDKDAIAIASDGVVTFTQEVVAPSLDISGDVDIDGTLEADAITVNGTTLAETISDTVGAMVGSNTETGITVTYQDADNTLDFALGAAQTTITSLLATDIKIGEDDQTKIDFETADEIHFYAANAHQVKIVDGAIVPATDNDVDLGTSSAEFKNAFFDGTVTADAFAGPINGDLTGTLQTAAQANVTSLGTLTTLTVDNVIINGTTIGHTDDTDLMTVADGILTVAGEVSMTTLDIGGTNVTSTAAELNILDGVTSTAAELNILDGATVVVGEINALDLGSTAVGNAIASKAVILDSNKDYTGVRNFTIDGDLDVGDDLFLTSDSAQVTFGANSEVTLTHVHDSGLALKHTATADDKPIILTLQTGETDIAANDVIGAINFQAPDEGTGTDAVLVAAGIEAVSEGDFSASNNATKLSFKTGASEAAAEKMSLSSAGLLTIADDLVIKDGGTIGVSSDADSITIASDGVVTFSQEIVAPSLDISGDVDIDGTLEADAITVNGTTLAETISDTVGAMVSSNTETGIAVTYQDADNTIDFALGAAQTTITSLLATDIKIGEDDQTKIDFETADEIHFYAANAHQIKLVDGALVPATDNDVDLGTSSAEFKDAFFDGTVTADAFSGPINGDLTGTLQTAAQANVTSLGTLTTLTVDNVIINGTTIGHTDDTDLMTVADGILTVAGEVSVTTLDIGGTNVTSTAAELNILDGVTSTAAELNVLDGITAVVGELNALDLGSTAVGNAIASKAVILDSNKDYTGIRNFTIDGDLDVGDDLKLTSDAALISFGANSEITMTHVHDTGLTLTHTATGDNTPMVLQLKSEEDAIIANEVIASLEFAAGDSDGTDGATVAAGIHAIAEGTFSASANATKLVFTTGVSETAASSATAKMTLSSAGLLTIADDLVIKDGGTIGVASDADAITIASNGQVTLTQTLIGTALDISGDVDIDGTLEADAITVNGTTLAETISDTVGAMVGSNTETGIAVTYQDGDNTIDFAINAAQTTITSLLATDIKIGEDDQTKIDFETADEIHFYAANAHQVKIVDGAIVPATDNDVDLGTSSAEFKNAFFDGTVTSDAFAGPLTGDVTGTSSKVTVTNSTANTNFPVVFNDESDSLLDDTGALRYNPSSGTLLVPNLVVAGTTTQVDTVTMNAENAVVFEGATADDHETTLTIIDPTADRTINLPNVSGTIPVLAAASTTQVTSTPEELNILDGATVVVGEINALDLGSTAVGTAIASKAVILDSNKDYTGVRNFTLSGELDAGSLDVSGDVDVDGTLEADAITVNGTTLAEFISDTAGAMVSSNTETGITVTYQDADNTIDFAINAAQTTITSLLATDIKIGEDDQTKIDFETADEIHFYAANAHQIKLVDGALVPATDNDVDLGTSSAEFKDAFFDGTVTADAFAGPINGDLTGTLQTAAQANVTSLGTLTALTVDNVVINGATIGHGDDTDLMTVADGILTVAGEVSMTTLDIGGTNVTSTAAELNILDGVTSTAAELNALDGITAVVGELNALDLGSTAVGNAIASKAVILDSNKDYTGIRNFTIDGDLDVGDDLFLTSDAAKITFGANSEITATHVHNVGLTLTHTATGANTPMVLELKSEEDAITSANIIGALHFSAGDSDGTDGATVAAAITAEAEGTFSASANATKLVFTTGVSETASRVGGVANAKMTLASDGDLTLAGTVTTTGIILGGTTVTSTGAELNILDGVTSTAAELNVLDGITAVVGELNALDIGSTAVGTAVASKAVILDSNKDYTGIRNLTLAGNIVIADAATIGSASDADAIAIGSDGDVTLTQDLELQHDGAILSFGANDEIKLTHVHDTGLLLTDSGGTPTLQFHDANESISSDGGHLIFTSNGVSFDFPSADGSNGQALITNGSGVFSFGDVASSTAADDISAGDGAVNITTSSGNITIDAAANDSDIIFKGTDGGADITMLTLDGSADGAAIFKSTITATGIIIGSTAVTSTAAELNILDGVTSTAAELNALDGITAVVGELNALDLGSTAVGNAIASKAVILDSNKDYTGIRNFTIDGDLDVGDDLKLTSDAAVAAFGADGDVTLTHVADTGLLLNGTMQLQFNDASQNINAPSGTVLDINATDEIELNATLLDVNANINASGTYTGAGTMTTGGNIVIPNTGNIGSVGDTDAIAIAANGVVTFSQAPVFPDGSIAVADLDIDGATDIGAAIVDADLFIVDDGAGGTNRKTTAARLKTYIDAASAPAQMLIKNASGTTIAVRIGHATSGGTDVEIQNSAGTALLSMKGAFTTGDAAV